MLRWWARSPLIAALSIGVLGCSADAQLADSVTAVHVAGSVYMLRGAGDVITASIGTDGVLLVDDGSAEAVEAVRARITELGGGPPRYVINSHWHHAGANHLFAPEATIISHRRARERLAAGSIMYTRPMPPVDGLALPRIVFEDSLSIHFNGEKISLIYLPYAHTDGDIAVIFSESNVVSLGDVFVTMIPVTDYASGGDLYSLINSVEYLLERLDPRVQIVPGHGRLATYRDLTAYHEMLTGMVAYMERQISQGLSEDQVVERGIPERWKSWVDPLLTPEFVLSNLYEGASRHR